ncbi:MAG: 30S ribosomal protein S8 [Deltaproteobacteria bacterium]|nr:30S ribosomal protein S8 [Deltaproteobacteria bacterium]
MSSDPIADMLTRVRNAILARFEEVDMPNSRTKTAIAQVLKDEGFIQDYEVIPDDKQGMLRIRLKYKGSKPVIEGIRRISRPSRRVYVPKDAIPRIRSGLGIAILSTNKGVVSDRLARSQGVGGEILCEVW